MVRIDGAEFTPFSRPGRQGPSAAGFHASASTSSRRVGSTPPAGVTGRARRAALRRALGDEMVRTMFATAPVQTTLFDALLEARLQHGGGHVVADDIEFRPMSYRGLITAIVALGARPGDAYAPGRARRRAAANVEGSGRHLLRAPSRRPRAGDAQLLDRAGGRAVRVPGGGDQARRHRAQIRREGQARGDGRGARVAGDGPVSRGRRAAKSASSRELGALIRSVLAKPSHRPERADEPAMVLFTSGSEGTPKGVVLSHRNLLANRHQLAAVVDFSPKDIVFNALPVFHSFGLTGGLLLPLLSRASASSCIRRRCTIGRSPSSSTASTRRSCSAPTRSSRATRGSRTTTTSTRCATCLPAPSASSRRRAGCGSRSSASASSRVTARPKRRRSLAVNTPMHFRAGTVGRLLPGIAHRLEPVQGIDGGGRLFVNGPNVMLGYLRAEKPGVIDPPSDGLVRHRRHRRDRCRGLRHDQGTREAVREGGGRDGAARRRRGIRCPRVAVGDARGSEHPRSETRRAAGPRHGPGRCHAVEARGRRS